MQRLEQVFGWADFPQPLFYECDFALRFELGGTHEMGPMRFLQAMDRARLIASEVFAGVETLTVIIPFRSRGSGEEIPFRLRKTAQAIGLSIANGATTYMPPRDSGEAADEMAGWCRFLFSFEIRNGPEQISCLIWAAVANGMGIRPSFPHMAANYIVDLARGIAMRVYDDRGMDLVAIRPSLLRPSYERFNGWLLDYDRERMAAMFAADPMQ
ncbi:DUF3885 domain-containing protein [Paracoccus laeviglucosivorans]|nr:DUF3885 domain-containing protein [Paracoccus laeviglucosivorans]